MRDANCLVGHLGAGRVPREGSEREWGDEQDLAIWKHKVHRANPVFCEGDQQLADYRKWARQFYTHPVGDARKPEGN